MSVRRGRDVSDGSPGSPLLVTPSDTVNCTNNDGNEVLARGILVEVSGDLSVETLYDGTVIIPGGAIIAGQVYPIHCTRINVTGTAATGIIVIY